MKHCSICRRILWSWQDLYGDEHYGCLARREREKAYDRLWEVLKPGVTK